MTTRGRGSVRIGPISLFALVIILCLAVMAVLSVTTAQATYAAAERQASFTTDTYANERAAQELVADVDAALAPVRAAHGGLDEALSAVRAALPEGAEMDGSTVKAEFTADSGRTLAVVLEIRDGRDVQRGVMEGNDAVDGERRRRDAVVGRCADTIGAMR